MDYHHDMYLHTCALWLVLGEGPAPIYAFGVDAAEIRFMDHGETYLDVR